MRLMAIKDIKNKILGFFKLQSPSLQVSWFKVLSNVFNDKSEFILNLKYYGKLIIWIILKSFWNYIEVTDLRLRTWCLFINFTKNFFMRSIFNTWKVINGKVLFKILIEPIHPIREAFKRAKIILVMFHNKILKGKKELPASHWGRVEGVERAAQRSRKGVFYRY